MSEPDTSLDLDRVGRDALREVMEGFVGLSVAELPASPDLVGAGAGVWLQATVPLTGPRLSGLLRLHLSRAFAAEAALGLAPATHRAPVGDSLVEDLAGELGNMLAGRVAAQLRTAGYSSELGIPEVVGGCPPAAVLGATPSRHSRTYWSCHGHPLTLEIQLRRLTS